ncbi:mannose-6-phosphate isomerase, type 1 [Anoxynatronum buryatiense]|uniref:mannose-6-phosphate isomerase n=2 Tax=Anoxynatronum buryatiense TaxID=489973 RepID=A0AA46AJT7_9CLOT|nr:mannose-6-phosphate isomerase, class I [Anoxynatronum buryatiense]SMP63417.1 mannose-6-phosphate isomerase, type 1 [Anoxynatronum buryatiense]
MELIFFDKLFYEKLWGGNRLAKYFDTALAGDKIGECWTVSGHPNGDSTVINGRYKGRTLSWLWQHEKSIFGNLKGATFPLLIKIIDAKEDLSVQVHPNDHYAHRHENGERGKTECWYILECEEGAELILGHHASHIDEMEAMIREERWGELLKKKKIRPGDFLYIPAGTIHSIGKGTLLLEIQQSSDVTYRVFDFNRLEGGRPRKLDISKSLDVITIPHQDYASTPQISHMAGGSQTCLVAKEHFTVWKLTVSENLIFEHDETFKLASVIKGSGRVAGIEVKKGDHFMVPHQFGSMKIAGEMEIILAHL